jgi:hypothetical protein
LWNVLEYPPQVRQFHQAEELLIISMLSLHFVNT